MSDFDKIQQCMERNEDKVVCRYFTKHDIYVYSACTGMFIVGYEFHKDYSLKEVVHQNYC